MVNDVNYNSDIREMIIANLDGWKVTDIPPDLPEPVVDGDTVEPVENPTQEESVEPTETITTSNNVEPFMTSEEIQNKPNKKITDDECRLFYEEALDLAYMHTNRLNIDDLTSIEARMFIRAVCKWVASNLWNKYNIRVNNEDMEDTYVQSYGGLLYHSALKALNPFINQHVASLSGLSNDETVTDNIWVR